MSDSLKGTLETILVVDDDETVLNSVVAVLENANFRVLSAGNSSGGWCRRQETGSRSSTAVAYNGRSEVAQNMQPLHPAGLRDGQQASDCYFPLCAAVAETDFAPLDSRAQRPFNRVVGGLHAGLFQERKQALKVLP